jgi:outer membrane protein TolC
MMRSGFRVAIYHGMSKGVVGLVLIAPLAWAETWSLESVLARAKVAAPGVQVAQRQVQEAEASRVGQGLPFATNPRLFADYRPLVIELPGQPSDPRHGYLVGLDGLLEVSGASGARLTEADKRVVLARQELAFEQASAAAAAWRFVAEVSLSAERVKTAERAVAVQGRVESAAREQFKAGVVGEPEVAVVSVEAASVKAQVEEAKREAMAANFSLQQVLDVPAGTLEMAGLSLRPPPLPSEDELLTRAVRQRPELAAIKARLALLEVSDDRLAREGFPKVGYNVGLDTAPASPGFAFLGLSVELPLLRNQGARAVVQAQRETEKTRLEASIRRAEREVRASRASAQSRLNQVVLLEEQAIPNARRSAELVEVGWRSGRYDLFRLTTALREVVRVEREWLESLAAAWADYIELQRVSGGL